MTILDAEINKPYKVSKIQTDQEEMKDFLFTLGCYSKESITLVSKQGGNFIVSIKGSRYSIDKDLAEAILLTEDSELAAVS